MPDQNPGLKLLRRPVLPLARLAQLLYLTGPFERITELLAELKEPIETASINYESPGEVLTPFLEDLQIIENLKMPGPTTWTVMNEDLTPLPPLEALDCQMAQQVLTRELETINSLLCGPRHCTLCCTGPTTAQEQDFFEIPLQSGETALFDLVKHDTTESRAADPEAEPPFSPTGRPFYRHGPAIYHWQYGWSMILPRNSSCPALDRQKGGCLIYQRRPTVCRRPQIFPYVVEAPAAHPSSNGPENQSRILRKKLLAIWDCPYVKAYKTDIAAYAEICELEPVFKKNKS